MQVKKAITYLAVVLAFAQSAWAEEVFTESGFTTGTSFESLRLGSFIANQDDFGEYSGSNYWQSAGLTEIEPVPGAYVAEYGVGEAYPYDGTQRNKMFGDPDDNDKYLLLDLEASLERRILLREVEEGVLEMDHVVLRQLKDGIYADTLVKLTPCVSAPAADGTDKIVVWLHEADKGDGTVTNLVITAGRYAGGIDKVERCDYTVAMPAVLADKWCRLTIRMIADITGKDASSGNVSGGKAAAFVVYVDGKPVCADASYDIGMDYRSDWIVPEARVLVSQRRLFPCLVPAGNAGAVEVSRFAFDGQGAIDDVAITTERPGHVETNKVFTLKWDAGVKSMTYALTTNSVLAETASIDATALPRFRDFAIGTNDHVQVTVTDVVYDTALGYTNGLWRAGNGCTNAGNAFVYEGGSENPIGFVASTRDVIAVGANATTGCATTFDEAKQLAKAKGVRTIELQSDMVITAGKQSGGYNDGGRLYITAGDDIILDLKGYTLQGLFNESTVCQNSGKLRITDSSAGKTGRILPSAKNTDGVVVKSISNSRMPLPELTIDAGWYDGFVVVRSSPGVAAGMCAIDGGYFTNAYEVTDRFYLEQYVTNATLYFGLSADNYWTTATNGYIWCGKGADTRWDNPANWKGNAVPPADALVIFPRNAAGNGVWDVDFGKGAEMKELLLDADIAMTGTNEFSGVAVVGGKGRIVGTGTAKFTGSLPGVLTEGDPGPGIRLGEGWKGTVLIVGITKAQPLTNIMYWGSDRSKVEFAGVRGYLSDRSNHALPYGLVLTDADGGKTPAWRNDTGYTGSTVSFPSLAGTGTFMSPKNTRDILQVFQFRNVGAFRGKFDLGGKRLLLGTGGVAAKSGAGHYTFSNAVKVRSGLGWQGVSAHFGAELGVYGAVGDPLMTFTGAEPDVSGVVVNLTDAKGAETKGQLAIDGNSVVIADLNVFKVNNRPVAAMSVSLTVRSGSVIDVPAGSALAIVGNDVVVNGRVVSTVAAYYKIQQVVGNPTSYSVSFNEEESTPSLSEFTVSSGGGKAVVTVKNAKPGLWYGLQTIGSLAEDWDANPTTWTRATTDEVTFEKDVGAASGFFRVIMTDEDPNGGEE